MNWTELQELAAAQALGALDGDDAARLKALAAQEAEARLEIASFSDIAAALALAMSAPSQPSPTLRAKILERVRSRPQESPGSTTPPAPFHEPRRRRREEAHSTSGENSQSLLTSSPTIQGFTARNSVSGSSLPAGFEVVLHDGSDWHPSPIPGVRVKRLSVSRDMGYQVRLAELAPGVSFPEHDHSSSEELFVLSGHLQTEGCLLGPGDFLHAEPGTHHHALHSPDGCVALIINRAPVAA